MATQLSAPVRFVHPDEMADIYAASGSGNCMVPLIAGDAMLAFDKREAIAPGDIVVLWFTPAAALRYGFPGWVKRLITPLPPAGMVGLISVEMLNPHRRFVIRSTDVLAVHKCVGEASPSSHGKARLASVGLRGLPSVQSPVESRQTEGPRLELFDEVPPWATIHAARDDSMAPLIRKGEIAVIEGGDRAGWLPQEGELFLIEYSGTATAYDRFPRRSQSLVVTRECKRSEGAWFAGPLAHKGANGMLYMSDGPYRNADALAHNLIGRVVGIYRPSIAETKLQRAN